MERTEGISKSHSVSEARQGRQAQNAQRPIKLWDVNLPLHILSGVDNLRNTVNTYNLSSNPQKLQIRLKTLTFLQYTALSRSSPAV